MAAIKVRNESRPTRCEICHQVDQFDAERNFCARCNVVPTGEALNLQDTEQLRAELDQLSASINQVSKDLEAPTPAPPMVAMEDDYYSRSKDDWVIMPAVAPEPEKPPEKPVIFGSYIAKTQFRRPTPEEKADMHQLQLALLLVVGGIMLLMMGSCMYNIMSEPPINQPVGTRNGRIAPAAKPAPPATPKPSNNAPVK
jgi:hypothetical protein